MKSILALEEVAMFLFSIMIFASLRFAWWWFPLLILAPDVSMIGYLVNNKAGAFLYNLFHHKAVAVAFMALGYFLLNDWLILAGAILFGHSSLDRSLGYGLKLSNGFSFTHLGQIGHKHEN